MSDPKDYTVGWICAITTEYVAAQCFLDERHDDPSYLPPNNKNDYTLGRIGKHNVVISVLPLGSQGSASAAQVAENMLHSFPNVRIGLLVGIGGGVPSPHDIRLGDVVVSTPSNGRSGVVQYDFGKTIQGQGFQPTGFLDQPPTVLRAAVSGLSAKYEIEGHQLKENVDEVLGKKPRLRKKYKRPEPDSDRLYQSHVVHREDSSDLIVREPRLEDEDDPVIHYGSIASANQSMNDALIRDKYGKAKGILCFEMEAAGLMNNFPCLVIRGICDYADSHQEKEEYAAWRGYAAMIAAAYAKDLLCRISPQHVETAQKAVEVLKISIDHIVETTDHVAAITERIDRNLSLDKLPTANAAEYNSHDDENEAECLEGTRTDLLRQITEWTSSPDGKCLFWLNGMAGTGKSTISRTVARSLKKRQKLGASFFFKRGEEDRGNAKKLFPSLAQQLVLQYPVLISRVRKAIEADPNIASKSLGEQFDQLLLQPLLDLEASGQENLVVLLDALDECDDDRDVRRIIRLMAQLQQVQAIRVRVFLTSRPELPIRLGFKNITDQDYQDLILHEIPERVTRHDISLFLKYRLTKIRIERDRIPYEWPTESIILSLVDMSVPLFISAATVCRYIEHSRFEPTARLQELLQDQTKYVTRMEKTYMPILTQLVNDLESDEIEQKQLLEDFQRIIGLILLLAVPLSIQSLSKLLNIETLPLRTHLDSFQSVLSVPNIGEDKPVRILHLSFRDFLTSTSDKRFRIEENTKHKDIFQLCLKTMNLHLKRNMCDLENPAAERANIDPQTIAHLFPPELSYACRYWGSHFERCDITEIEAVDLLLFLKEHLLHYIEAMALLGLVSEVPRVIGRLRSDDSIEVFLELSAFLYDADRFIRRVRQVIDKTPLQLYCSALIFAPETSIVRKEFEKEVPPWICQVPQLQRGWNAELEVLKGHTDSVRAVAFSPDGRLLVSGSDDGTLRLWDATTFEIRETISCPDPVSSIAISTNSRLVASRLKNYKTGSTSMVSIRSLDGMAGDWERTINCQVNVSSIAFSPDGRLLATGCFDNAIRLWDVETGEVNREFEVRGHYPTVAFSYTGQTMAFMSAAEGQADIEVWDRIAGKVKMNIMGSVDPEDRDRLRDLEFSPDTSGEILMFELNGDIHLWDTVAGTQIRKLQYPGLDAQLIRFSYDGCYISSSCGNGNTQFGATMLVWDQATGKPLHKLQVHEWVNNNSMAFAPGNRLLATSNGQKVVWLWDPMRDNSKRKLEGHQGDIRLLAFSADGEKLASCSADHTARLWDSGTGALLQTSELDIERPHSLAFSPDGQQLAIQGSRGALRILDFTTGTVKPHECPINLRSIAFSSDGHLIGCFGSARSGTPRLDILDLTTGETKNDIYLPNATLYHLAFSPNSRYIATLNAFIRDKVKAHVFELATGSEKQFELHNRNNTPHLIFSHDSSYLWCRGTSMVIHQVPASLSCQEDPDVIGVTDEWLVWNGQRLIWLGDELGLTMWAICGNLLALGYSTGRVSFLKLWPFRSAASVTANWKI